MNQVIFSKNSSAELSSLPQLLQLDILSEFKNLTPDYIGLNKDRFGILAKDQRTIYRYRAKDFRIYFEIIENQTIIHRVLHKNTLRDFFYRSQIPIGEDEHLQRSPQFWAMIDSK